MEKDFPAALPRLKPQIKQTALFCIIKTWFIVVSDAAPQKLGSWRTLLHNSYFFNEVQFREEYIAKTLESRQSSKVLMVSIMLPATKNVSRTSSSKGVEIYPTDEMRRQGLLMALQDMGSSFQQNVTFSFEASPKVKFVHCSEETRPHNNIQEFTELSLYSKCLCRKSIKEVELPFGFGIDILNVPLRAERDILYEYREGAAVHADASLTQVGERQMLNAAERGGRLIANAAERGGRLCLYVARSALSLALQALIGTPQSEVTPHESCFLVRAAGSIEL
ncbi:hypothetical protein J6590_054963 [Homalodisca vitripennis]|nr:hypothetical protein J6590_054963 [Homalodisca vitripennis]